MVRQFWILCVLAVFLIECFGYRHTSEHKMALERIKRYAKREVTGNCIYNMCNETEGYPIDEIRSVVEKHEEYRELFGTVVAPFKPMETPSRLPEIGREENMCESQSYYMLPQKAIDTAGVWQTVVNAGGKYQQIVNFEACAQEAKCIAENSIPDRITLCAQNEILLKMLSFNQDQTTGNDKPFKMSLFRIPSGCACMHKEVL